MISANMPLQLMLPLLLGVLLALVLLHLLLQRRVRLWVPTLRVWQYLARFERDAPAQRTWFSVHLLLQMALAVLLLLAAAGVHWLHRATGGQTVVLVLHNDTGMDARLADGRTRWEAAVQAAENRLAGLEPADRAAVLTTAPTVSGSAGPTTAHRDLQRKLGQQFAVHAPGRLDEAVARALDMLAGAGGRGRVEVFSDTAPSAMLGDTRPAGLVWHRIGEQAPNVGIVALDTEYRPEDATGRLFVGVVNQASKPADVEVVARRLDGTAASAELARQSVRVPAGERQDLVLPLRSDRLQGLVVLLQGAADALAADDAVWATAAVRSQLEVAVVGDAPEPLLRALWAEGRTNVTAVADVSAADPETDAFVFYRALPSALPPKPVLIIAPPRSVGPVQLTGERFESEQLVPAADAWDGLLAALSGTPVASLPRLQVVGAADVLVRSEREATAAVVRWRDQGQPRYVVSFDVAVENSAWTMHETWPVFTALVLRDFRGGTETRSLVWLQTGRAPAQRLSSIGSSVRLSGPRGVVVSGVEPLPLVGLYDQIGAQNGSRWAVNLLRPGESDISLSPPLTADARTLDGGEAPLRTDLTWIFLLMALLTLFAEWLLWQRQEQ